MLAAEQEKLEKTLASEKPDNPQLVRPGEGAQESVEHEDPGNSGLEDAEQGEAASGGSEEEEHEGNESGGNTGFFYENEEGEDQEEDLSIGARVAARKRGCLHNGGGQME